MGANYRSFRRLADRRSKRCPSQNGDTSSLNAILGEVVLIRGYRTYDRLVRAPRPTRDRR